MHKLALLASGLATLVAFSLPGKSPAQDLDPAARRLRGYASDPFATLQASFEGTTAPEVSVATSAVLESRRVRFVPGAQGTAARFESGSRLVLDGRVVPLEEGLVEMWLLLHAEEESREAPRPRVLFVARGPGRELSLAHDSRGRLLLRLRGNGREAAALTSPQPSLTSRLTHVAFAWRSEQLMAIYVDGHLEATAAIPGVALTSPDSPMTEVELAPEQACTLDELLISSNTDRLLQRVHRDHLRTTPLRAIRIDLAPFGLPSDHLVVTGQRKQIGIRGITPDGRELELISLGGSRDRFFEAWDGRGVLELVSENPQIAITDEHGGIRGVAPGRCRITARYGNHTVTALFVVLPDQLPDLSVRLLERDSASASTPFASKSEELVYFAHIANHGTVAAPPFRYTYRVLEDPTGEGRYLPELRAINEDSLTFGRSLRPGESAIIEIRIPRPLQRHFIEMSVDPTGSLAEFSRVNNVLAVWSEARSVRIAAPRSLLQAFRTYFTLVGSMGLEDLLQAHLARINRMLEAASFPYTTRTGVHARLRLDEIRVVPEDTPPTPLHRSWEDIGDHGLLVLGPELITPEDSGRFQHGLLHELCHGYLGLPDSLCYGVRRNAVYVVGPDGVPARDRLAALTRSPVDGSVFVAFSSLAGPEGSIGLDLPEVTLPARGLIGLGPMMTTSYPRLSASHAAHVQFYRSLERPEITDSFTRNVPQISNRVLITDLEERPLVGARVRVFQLVPGQGGCYSGYFPTCPKFTGHTDGHGFFLFPRETDVAWDDPETDAVEGRIRVLDPFGTSRRPVALTPGLDAVDSILLVEVAVGSRVVYHFLDIDHFHLAFYTGDGIQGSLSVRTHVTAAEAESAPHLERSPLDGPAATTNLRPVATITASPSPRAASDITLDSAGSHDPEGRPLRGFFWQVERGGSVIRGFEPRLSFRPEEPGDYRVRLVVNDGVRDSEPAEMRIEVAP